MTAYLSSLITWTVDNNMELNASKTKEMILGRMDSSSISPVFTMAQSNGSPMLSYLGSILMLVYLGLPTSISSHRKQVSDYFLKQLRRAGVSSQQLLLYCTSVIRPVFEYASPVWHYSITRAESEQLESIQKWVIFTFSHGMSYPNLLFVFNLNSLKDRCNKLSRSFFQNMCNPASCLHHLFPPSCNTSVTFRLRSSTPLFRPTSRTKEFQSFVNFALNKYQSHM